MTKFLAPVSVKSQNQPPLSFETDCGDASVTLGQGSPEGLIEAPEETLYLDVGTGMTYRKTTASGDTGWVALALHGLVESLADRPDPTGVPLGTRIQVRTNNLIYYVREGEWVVESALSRVPDMLSMNDRTELELGQLYYVGSLGVICRWNGQSYVQESCCPIPREGVRTLIGFPPSPVITARVGERYDAETREVEYRSSSQPSKGNQITLLRYTITISDAGQPNDGRTIVVEATGDDAVPTVASDTGGTAQNRLTDQQLQGIGCLWKFTADTNNDIVVSSAGSMSVELYVEDSSGASANQVLP